MAAAGREARDQLASIVERQGAASDVLRRRRGVTIVVHIRELAGQRNRQGVRTIHAAEWVAGIVGGGGAYSNDKYIGVAPMSDIVNVKVSNDNGSANVSNVVAGMQWVLNNKARLNIRVVNLSLNMTGCFVRHRRVVLGSAS